MIKQIKYWWYRYQNDGVPSPEEIRDIMRTYPEIFPKFKHVRNTKFEISLRYSYGATIQKLAEDNKVTRERIRQILCGVYRTSKSPERRKELIELQRKMQQ